VAKTVLFLCTGNYYRSRFAETYFNSVAAKMGLPWRATSRALAIERGANNVGPMAVESIAALKALGIASSADYTRMPKGAEETDFTSATRVVALKEAEHRSLMVERFAQWAETTEYWGVDDKPGVLNLIEREVMALIARLFTGAKREGPPPEPEVAKPEAKPEKPKKKGTVRVGRETKGRGGKGVTLVWDIPLRESEIIELGAELKKKVGTGGTVKDGRIEIQGDQRDRITAELEKLGFTVKRVGG
jgi:predicted translation initiation factor SUI1